MIDWLSFVAPLSWDRPINEGAVLRVDRDGVIVFEVPQRRRLPSYVRDGVIADSLAPSGIMGPRIHRAAERGSFVGSMTVRSIEAGFVEVSGNPSKWFQGHNLFGSCDLPGLVLAIMERLTVAVGVEPSVEDRAAWTRGDVLLSRVDCTAMYELATVEEVMQWIEAASETSQVKWRGRGHFQPGTLYFGKVAVGKRASNWQLKFYAKGREIQLPGHQINPHLPYASQLFEWAQNKLRIELTLRTGELKRLGLVKSGAWSPDRVSETLLRYLAKVEMGEQQMMTIEREEQLKPAQMNVLAAWKAGANPKSYMSKATFYRYRDVLLDKTGVDIGLPPQTSNVVPLIRVLQAKPASMPDWYLNALYEPPERIRLVS